mgnify:CR=1 FL=1
MTIRRLDAEEVRRLGHHHAEVETAGQLEETMATLVEDPIYDFFPAGSTQRLWLDAYATAGACILRIDTYSHYC